MVEIGNFDTKITYLLPVQTTGSQGEVIIDYLPVHTAFAHLQTNIDEFNSDSNLEQARSLNVTTYKYPLSTRHRVRIGVEEYEITSITPAERMQPFMTINLTKING